MNGSTEAHSAIYYYTCVVVNCTVRFGSLSEALLKTRTSPGLDILLAYGLAVAMAIYYSHGLAIATAWLWLWPGCGLAVAMAHV